ncbi:MAG: hypothetical protein AB7T27_00330 [Kiritimatiellia bacterium]
MKKQALLLQGLLFFAVAILFTANCNSNLFGLGKPGQFEGFQMDSEESVRVMLQKVARDGYWSSGGFMMARDIDKEPYMSAWGLQGKVASALYLLGGQKSDFIKKGHFTVSLLFGIMMALFTVFLCRRFGWFVSLAFAVLLSLSDWLVFAGRNMYLVYFLHLLPFVLSFMLFPLVVKNRHFRFAHFLWIIGAASLFNALCFFDYVSNIVLSTAIGPLFFGICERKDWRQISRWVIFTLLASGGAVILSVLAIGVQTALYTGEISSCFNHIIHQAAFRSIAAEQNQQIGTPPGVSAWMIFEQYLTLPMISLPFQKNPNRYRIFFSLFAAIAALLPLGMSAGLDRKVFPRFASSQRMLWALAVSTAWGLAASLSWAFLMKGHMFHHMHMNGMLFYIPYMLMIYIFFAVIVRLLLLQVWDWVRNREWPCYAMEDESKATVVSKGFNTKKRSS